MKKTRLYLLLFLIVLVVFSCKKDNEEDDTNKATGQINLHFRHHVDGNELDIDTLIYFNEAGNQYLINEIQYFISDLTLYHSHAEELIIDSWKDTHYVDTDLPSTHLWEIPDEIPAGSYDSVSFTFGISQEKNQSFMFVNPPESFMFWPEYLGGGYHYMKLNGKWLNQDQIIEPFDFHLGIGQILDTAGQIIGFVHNEFDVGFPDLGFDISDNQILDLNLTMNIERWFKDPHTYDHDVWGGYIMQNQEAMKIASDNGRNVFEMEVVR